MPYAWPSHVFQLSASGNERLVDQESYMPQHPPSVDLSENPVSSQNERTYANMGVEEYGAPSPWTAVPDRRATGKCWKTCCRYKTCVRGATVVLSISPVSMLTQCGGASAGSNSRFLRHTQRPMGGLRREVSIVSSLGTTTSIHVDSCRRAKATTCSRLAPDVVRGR